MSRRRGIRQPALLSAAAIFAALSAFASAKAEAPDRASLIARAQVWSPTDIPSLDLARGPRGPGSFEPGATVTCDYLEKDFEGNSRKFGCRIVRNDPPSPEASARQAPPSPEASARQAPSSREASAQQAEVKVKFGAANGEVQGEVAATRLLWALGFGADRMYPVRVICRGCPDDIGDVIDPAVIERKLPGREVHDDGDGWSWPELDLIDEHAGGATVAQRDALKLLAVLMQHTDTKPEQQRLVCVGDAREDTCAKPLMMLNDVGLTFGRATLGNLNPLSSVNFEEWATTPVWKGPIGCVGNLPRSLSGTLKDPVIGDGGRRFLAHLLMQLSDAQLRDLFTVARADLREASPTWRSPSGVRPHTVDEWVHAFKEKREEIVERRCLDSWSLVAPPTFGTAPIVWLQSRATSGVSLAMNIVSFLGYTGIYIAIATALALGFRWRAGAALLLLVALSALISNATKTVVAYPRPDAVDGRVQNIAALQTDRLPRMLELVAKRAPSLTIDDDAYGFPSGHVAAATVFFFGLVFFFGWRWAWAGLALWVPAMAISRVYLGRHFPGDVLGGFGAGVIVTAIGLQALNLRRFSARDVDLARAWRIARRMLVVAAGFVATAMLVRVPDTYDAARLLGLAAGVLLLARRSNTIDAAPLRVRAGRVALAAVLFPAAWWSLPAAVRALGDGAAGTVIGGAIPFALLIAGPPLLTSRPWARSSVRLVPAPRRHRTIARTPPS